MNIIFEINVLLKHLIINTFFLIREKFLPYLYTSFDILSKLLEEDDEDTIDSVLEAYGQLCINLSQVSDITGQECKFVLY